MNRNIIFSNPDNIKTGFLCNNFYTYFYLDDVNWYSVEHYITAKKFQGTAFEELLRKTRTIEELRRLTKPKITTKNKKGKIYKIKTYGRGKYIHHNFDISQNWKSDYINLIRKATFAKFSQNKNLQILLKKTKNYTLICKTDRYLGPILEEIRDKLNNSKRIQDVKINWSKDYSYKKIHNDDKIIISNILNLCFKIMKFEFCGKIYHEMVTDSLINFIPNDLYYEYDNFTKQFMKDVDWTYFYTNLPNYQKLLDYIEEYISSKNFEDITKSSIIIFTFLFWINHRTKYKKVFIDRQIPEEEIFLSKGKRRYRK